MGCVVHVGWVLCSGGAAHRANVSAVQRSVGEHRYVLPRIVGGHSDQDINLIHQGHSCQNRPSITLANGGWQRNPTPVSGFNTKHRLRVSMDHNQMDTNISVASWIYTVTLAASYTISVARHTSSAQGWV